MTDDKIFEEYLEKKEQGISGFFKNPKSWVILVCVVVAIILLVVFLKTLSEGMSSQEVKNSIQIAWHDTKWVDKEVTPQEVKIVPTISLKIKNVGERPLQYMDIEAVFEFIETGLVHSDGMARVLTKEPLMPGETSEEIFIKSLYGYSATSRAAFMQNKAEWKPMQVKIYARAKGSGLVRVGDVYPVKQVIEGYDETLKPGDQMPDDYADEVTRELAHSIRIVEQDSLWVDKPAVGKQVIIVPAITIEIKNVGSKPLHQLYFQGVFKFEDTKEILSEGLTPALGSPLGPGETSKPIEIKADFGYAGESKQALADAFFKSPEQRWRRLKVHIYARSKDSQNALLGIFPIKAKIQGVKLIN
ncbi:MAG: hypothetical protein JSV88_26440 [Candidatus Aminicenantes bacterium]|nr:MAG: hypothetical protein JSV88_26440 [Candidatus Aminicenantes bacterium]